MYAIAPDAHAYPFSDGMGHPFDEIFVEGTNWPPGVSHEILACLHVSNSFCTQLDCKCGYLVYTTDPTMCVDSWDGTCWKGSINGLGISAWIDCSGLPDSPCVWKVKAGGCSDDSFIYTLGTDCRWPLRVSGPLSEEIVRCCWPFPCTASVGVGVSLIGFVRRNTKGRLIQGSTIPGSTPYYSVTGPCGYADCIGYAQSLPRCCGFNDFCNPTSLTLTVTDGGGCSGVAGTYTMSGGVFGGCATFVAGGSAGGSSFSFVLLCCGMGAGDPLADWLVRFECPDGTLVSTASPGAGSACYPFDLRFPGMSCNGACGSGTMDVEVTF